LILAALLLGAASANADWLVRREGVQVETRGPFAVDGDTVRYVDARGVARTCRRSEIDVEASLAASHRPSAPPEATAPETVPAVMTGSTVEPDAPTSARRPRPEGRRVFSPLPPPPGSPLAAAAADAQGARLGSGKPVAVLRDGDVKTMESGVGGHPTAGVTADGRPRIVLYGTTWCPWCKKARKLLSALGADWVEKDTETTPGASAELDQLAGEGAGVPVIVYGVHVVRGYNEMRIKALVLESRMDRGAAARRAPG
jgi:glutaredoxin